MYLEVNVIFTALLSPLSADPCIVYLGNGTLYLPLSPSFRVHISGGYFWHVVFSSGWGTFRSNEVSAS